MEKMTKPDVWIATSNHVIVRRLLPDGYKLDSNGDLVNQKTGIAIIASSTQVGGGMQNFEGVVIALGKSVHPDLGLKKGDIVKFRKFAYTVYTSDTNEQYICLTDESIPTYYCPGRDPKAELEESEYHFV